MILKILLGVGLGGVADYPELCDSKHWKFLSAHL